MALHGRKLMKIARSHASSHGDQRVPKRFLRSKRGKRKIRRVLGEFKRGTLHAGRSRGLVKSRRQAQAIAFSEARRVQRGR